MSRFVTNYKLAGTKPFRLASSKLFGEFGGNASNPDGDTMSIYVAPPGMVFVQSDQSGADALIVAYLAPPGRYRRLFERAIKPHTYIALHIFAKHHQHNWPFTEPYEWYLRASVDELADHPSWPNLSKVISKDPRYKNEYFIGKKTGHSFNYEGGPRTLQMSILKDSGGVINLSYEETKIFHATVATLFPEIAEWQRETKDLVRSKRELRNLLGFPRRFEQTITDSYLRDALSWVPASTVACITRAAVISTQHFIESNRRRWNIVNDKHDSFMLEVPEEEKEEARTFMESQLARRMIGRDSVPFVMRSESKWGYNWGDMDERNPKGMRSF